MRPIRRYICTFSHPRVAGLLEVETSGCTPCEARGAAWGVLEEIKHTDRKLPQDNHWALVGLTTVELNKALGR